jgi:alkylation response protein AidB-like acyl-CoA dehydrogenase
MDFSFNPLERELMDRAKQIAPALAERAREFDESAGFPDENFALLRDAGLLKLTVPVEYGGYGLWADDRYLAFYLILETLAAGCSSTAQLLQVHCHCTSNIASLANDEQKRRILADVVERGALIGSAGNFRAQVADGSAALVPVEGGFRFSCKTFFGSLSARADYLLAFAAAPGANTFGEVVVLCLPRDMAGIEVTDTWSEVMGMRATVSWSTSFDDIFVPWQHVIGEPGEFIRDPRGWTLAYSANFLGTAQGAFDFTIDYVKKKPHLIDDDVVAYMIGSMESALQAARTSLWYACWLWEKKDYQAAELASLRFNHVARETALDITSKVFEICGASAAFRRFPLERALRDTRTFTLHTRESSNMRLLANAAIKGEFHAKQWFAPKAQNLTWENFGVTPPAGHS